MIRNGMGPEVRQAIREKIALKFRAVTVTFMNDCHGEDGRFCRKHGVVHGKEDDPFGVSRQPKGRAPVPKSGKIEGMTYAAVAELRAERSKVVTSGRLNFTEFPEEVGAMRNTRVRVSNNATWLSKDQFLALKGRNGESALDRIGRPDLHGYIVVNEKGQYLDPFSTSHARYRLEQADMAELVDTIPHRVNETEALAVELKPTKVSNSRGGAPRAKNRLYVLSKEAGKKVALNVAVGDDGRIITAFMEFSNGTYAHLPKVREAIAEHRGTKLRNRVIHVKEFS